MMRVMTLIACKVFSGSKLCIPETVNPSVDAGLPVPVGYPMTFPTKKDRLIFGNYGAIMISKSIRVIYMMAIQASKIQAMCKIHILMRAEGEM